MKHGVDGVILGYLRGFMILTSTLFHIMV